MKLAQIVQRHPLLMKALGGDHGFYRKWRIRQERVFFETMDNIGRTVDQDISVRLPEYGGSFLVSPRSALFTRVARTGTYEPGILDLFYKHLDPSRDVIDIGANIGFFTVAAATRSPTSRVLAVEPTSGAFGRLAENVRRNGVESRVVLFKGAAADREGTIEINQVVGREEYSSIGVLAHPSIVNSAESSITESVPMTTLDALVAEHDFKPGLIKVDVEGGEFQVFAGARETLLKHRPVLISEISDVLLKGLGSSRNGLVDLLQDDLGYKVTSVEDPDADPRSRDGEIICLPV